MTEDFWPQGDFVAQSLGMPDAPRVRLPHPVAGTGEANLHRVAAQVVDEIMRQPSGKPDYKWAKSVATSGEALVAGSA